MGYHEQFRYLVINTCSCMVILTNTALYSKYLKEQTLPKLDGLHSDVKKQAKQLTKKIEKASGSLKKSEEEAVAAMLAHQKICEDMVMISRSEIGVLLLLTIVNSESNAKPYDCGSLVH